MRVWLEARGLSIHALAGKAGISAAVACHCKRGIARVETARLDLAGNLIAGFQRIRRED